MARQRSIFSLVLVVLATFLISCSGSNVAAVPPTYTSAQLQRIQEYVPDIQEIRTRGDELQKLIETNEWVKVGNFIHGPMAELKLDMSYIAPNLLPNDQPTARKITRDMFSSLVQIDQAATVGNKKVALNNYVTAFNKIDEFLKLMPDTSTSEKS
jgi:photosystem II protein PsbQ